MTRRDGWFPFGVDDLHGAAGRGRPPHPPHPPRPPRPPRPGWGGGGGWGGGPPWDGQPWASFLQAVFGRGQRARRGDVRAGILLLLDEEARNGYQLMQELERRSQGAWRPSSGSVYPTLQQLEDEGLVAAGKDESNRIYRLTDRGRAHVAKHREELGTPWETETAAGDPRWEVMNAMRELGPALAQVVRFGTPEQVAEARRIVTEARRGLYRVLAGEDDAEEE
jgi:DNA-binding PadR family transcriptional regulator